MFDRTDALHLSSASTSVIGQMVSAVPLSHVGQCEIAEEGQSQSGSMRPTATASCVIVESSPFVGRLVPPLQLPLGLIQSSIPIFCIFIFGKLMSNTVVGELMSTNVLKSVPNTPSLA